MTEIARPPVAIRIVRPFQSEDEWLEHELETIGKTSLVLVGAHPRPTGVILRFEVALSSGVSALRGEGRVLGHKDNAFRGQPGLILRFTRLDPRSKAIVDRATLMREPRQEGSAPSIPAIPGSHAGKADGPVADALTASTPIPGPSVPTPSSLAHAEQEAAVASARASLREKANAAARANARRTATGPPPAGGAGGERGLSLTPPPLPVGTSLPPSPLPSDRPHEATSSDVVGRGAHGSSSPRHAGASSTHAPTARSAPPFPSHETSDSLPPEASPTSASAALPSLPPPTSENALQHSVGASEETLGASASASVASVGSVSSSLQAALPPDERERLLTWLRQRHNLLGSDRVEEILTRRR